MEFVSSLVGHLLSWPVLVAVVVYIFRIPLRDLIGRIRSYEGLGQKINFGEQLAEAEDSVDQAIETITSDESATGDREEPAESPLARDAETNPSFVIISSWERLNGALADLVGTTTDDRTRASGRSPASALPELERRNVVNNAYTRAVFELRTLRNRVAHGQHNPTAGEAVTYAESAEELRRAAHVLANLYVQRQQRKANEADD
jgi:hypothetical protein